MMGMADMKKKPPALAIALGVPKGAEDEEDVDDEGADDKEEAMTAGGQAFIEAMKANDALGVAKAVAAIVDAHGGGEDIEAGDLDVDDEDLNKPVRPGVYRYGLDVDGTNSSGRMNPDAGRRANGANPAAEVRKRGGVHWNGTGHGR
jgi:hypothetical protein